MTAEQLEALYSDDAPKSPDYNTMQFGHKGEDVMKLQTWLAVTKYYDGKQTGTYSLAVREAVKSFQQKHGLGNTGIADEETVKLLQAEAQRESSKAGDQMLLKTAKITDSALASLAEDKIVIQSPGEVLVTSGNSRDLVRTIVIFATVLIFAVFLSIIFLIELKRRTRYLAAETDISKYYRRRF